MGVSESPTKSIKSRRHPTRPIGLTNRRPVSDTGYIQSIAWSRIMLERRRSVRRRGPLTGRICISKRHERACEIRNISPDGASIVTKTRVVPQVFLLRIEDEISTERICRIVWRKGSTIGIQFLNARPSPRQ